MTINGPQPRPAVPVLRYQTAHVWLILVDAWVIMTPRSCSVTVQGKDLSMVMAVDTNGVETWKNIPVITASHVRRAFEVECPSLVVSKQEVKTTQTTKIVMV